MAARCAIALLLGIGTASGAAVSWNSAVPANWNTSGSWSPAAVPVAGDAVTFPAAMDGNCTIDADVAVTSITIDAGYSGTITQNTTMAIVLTGAWTQADGVFVGSTTGSVNENIDITGAFTLTGGDFTSTRSRLYVGGAFTVGASGDFIHNSGTVLLMSASDRALTCSDSFNDLILNDSLIARWTFDEASTPSLDSSGNGHHATWSGTPTQDTTIKPTLDRDNSGSMGFNASGEYMAPADVAPFLTKPVTIAAWVYMPNAVNWYANPGGDICTIFNVHDGTSGYSLLGSGTDNVWMFRGAFNALCTAVTRDTWHHIAGSYLAGRHRSYTNGVKNDDFNFGDSLTIGAGSNAWIGRSARFTGYYLNATIDDVHVFSEAVDDAVIARLAAGRNAAKATSTVTLGSPLDIAGDLTIASGGFNTAAYDISVAGSWLNSGGVFTAGTRTVKLVGPAGGTIDGGGSAFADLHLPDVAEDDLILYLPFDDGAGTNVNDASATGNDGTLLDNDATAAWNADTPAAIDFANVGSLSFDGDANYVTVTDHASHHFVAGDSITISAWIKPTAQPNRWQAILAKGNNFAYVLYFGAGGAGDGRLAFGMNAAGYSQFASNGPVITFVTPTWQHVAVVHTFGDGTSTILYLDGRALARGVAANQTAWTDSDGESIPTIDTDFLLVGYRDSTEVYTGLIDDVRMYAAILTPSQIATIASGSAIAAPTTWTLAAPLDVDRDLLLDGNQLAAGTRAITLGRDWRNGLGVGAFSAGTGTVTLDGTDQAITGSTTFHHLVKTATDTSTLTFPANKQQTFTGDLTLRGTNRTRMLRLRSSIPGTYADIDPQGARTCSFVNVQDNRNLTAPAINATNSFDAGNDVLWFFPPWARGGAIGAGHPAIY